MRQSERKYWFSITGFVTSRNVPAEGACSRQPWHKRNHNLKVHLVAACFLIDLQRDLTSRPRASMLSGFSFDPTDRSEPSRFSVQENWSGWNGQRDCSDTFDRSLDKQVGKNEQEFKNGKESRGKRNSIEKNLWEKALSIGEKWSRVKRTVDRPRGFLWVAKSHLCAAAAGCVSLSRSDKLFGKTGSFVRKIRSVGGLSVVVALRATECSIPRFEVGTNETRNRR